jgi:hypothetical protein
LPPECLDPDDLAAVVIDLGIVRERRHNRVRVERIHSSDVFDDDA